MAQNTDTAPLVQQVASDELQQAAAIRDCLHLVDELGRVAPQFLLPLARKLSLRLIWLLSQNQSASPQEYLALQERLANLRGFLKATGGSHGLQ
jgi:hypothetical protein